ncbi:signal recognition particle-docking protein FtsY [Actinopolyspora erythraea]|uniref:Signal recognition particle receptor FtsY n=1 Tax=Actinopolyspora erythraea TaxID=414996 RepID=A0A099D8E6_9ACTN|nr:signal recognition particle-docking protein FtsY [Actinopolyspora erythraea]ASU78115.1 signal recognition particle-docking protein FtsY [Actinopolyspora erythraea]KGI81675.1 cell division protein FtsY [Actinopolyspora erythraea]
MSTTNVILIIVAALVVLAALVGTGILLARRRRVSLAQGEREDTSADQGGYRAGSGISLSSGGTTTAPAHPVEDRTETEGQPGVGDDAAVPRDSQRRGIVDVPLPDSAESDAATSGPESGTATTGGVPAGGSAAPETPEAPESPAVPEQQRPSEPEPEGSADTATSLERPEEETGSTGGTASAEAAGTVPPRAPEESEAAAEDAGARSESSTAETEAGPAAPAEVEPIEPSAGRLERLRGRLSRSRSMFGQSVLGLLGAGDLDEDSWEEIEDTLLMADLGATTASEIIERLRTEVAARGVRTPDQARTLLREVLMDALATTQSRSVQALPHGDPTDGGKPAVVLVVGVNGTGKTTTTGKLARVLVVEGRSVLLGAADTFRAAAVEQLGTWGERVGAEVIRGEEGADPASVAFESVQRGADSGVDAVLVDTAGRLHTKTGLMDELGKVKRVVDKRAQVDEVLLVLDATTGQNGLAQARVFADVVDVTGIVLTKLDGTAKGGIVFQVQRELGVPVKLVGLGEGADDLAPFEPEAFVDALLG